MENIINTFYKGNINKFGFGGWNTTKNNIPEILGSYPYPSNANRQIGKYFLKNEKDESKTKNLHKNYVPSIISQMIPPSERVDFSNANAQELKPISISQYKNFDNYGFMNTQVKPVPQQNFSPALIRMEYLEQKVADLENKNRAEMAKSLNEINNNYIDPRFKKFLDNNQGKYDVFGNDIDPLEQRRAFVQNNLGNIRNQLDTEEKIERKKRRKKEKKLKKKKKKKRKFFGESEESGDEEEQNEEEGNEFSAGENNNEENNLNNMTNKSGSQQFTPALTRGSIKKPSLGAGYRRKSLMSTLVKNNTLNKTNASKRGSVKSKANGRKSVISTMESKESKEIKKDIKKSKEVKVCGDIGYNFTAKTGKEKELQYQTNRLGKDFDVLFNEINNFKNSLKQRMDSHNNEENTRLNVLKDIFLLDNKASMKFAVDKIINKSNEVFDNVQYQKKVDREKQEEINDLINKKIDEYNNNLDQNVYIKRVQDERDQMIHHNAIHTFQYKKYRAKLNSQVVTLPNIYIQPTKGIKNRQKKKRKKKVKKGDEIIEVEVDESEEKGSKNMSDSNGSSYVEELSEETVKDFGTSINGNDQYRTKAKREIRRRSETYIELPEVKKSKNNSKILPNNIGEEKDNNEDKGKLQLMKAIQEKEKSSKKTNTTKNSRAGGEEVKEEEKKEEEEKNEEEEKEKENDKEKKEKEIKDEESQEGFGEENDEEGEGESDEEKDKKNKKTSEKEREEGNKNKGSKGGKEKEESEGSEEDEESEGNEESEEKK